MEYEIALVGAPDVSSGIDFQRRGPIIVRQVLSVPFKGPERLWWGKILGTASLCLISSSLSGWLFLSPKPRREKVKEIESAVSTVSRLSEDTAAGWEISPVGSSC